ncbi:MAG TPA: glycosyltransferase family 4 protein, partial [Rhodopila sp.]|nr:glycosyltransferase family 4 protein [Rhodopila sp.]
DTVEVMHNQALDTLANVLHGRLGYYDLIWVARTHNLEKIRPILDRVHGQDTAAPPVILDTEALTPYREALRIALGGGVFDPEPGMRAVQDLSGLCAATVAVTAAETELLQARGINAFTVGHTIEARPTPRAFAQRSGMLFVGAIHTADSPNLDSLHWFVDSVLPLIEAELGWETRLMIAGYVAPGIDVSRFRHHPRITLRGQQADLEPLYNSSRIFVAPTRYAAGAPYKVLEAASRGVPVVCTEVLRHQIEWTPAQEIIAADAADPAAFAAAAVALYRDESLWQTVRDGALRRLRQDHGWDEFSRSVARVLAARDAVVATSTGPSATRAARRSREIQSRVIQEAANESSIVDRFRAAASASPNRTTVQSTPAQPASNNRSATSASRSRQASAASQSSGMPEAP